MVGLTGVQRIELGRMPTHGDVHGLVMLQTTTAKTVKALYQGGFIEPVGGISGPVPSRSWRLTDVGRSTLERSEG